LCVLGQAPLHLWGITLIGLALLYLRLLNVRVSDKPLKAGFHSAFWFGLGYFGIGVFWVGSAFIARGAAFIPVMPPMVLGLAALLALFWALAGAAFVKANLKPVWSLVGFISLFMIAEFARGHAFGGLPWNLPGYIFPAGSLPSQSASLWTIYGQTLIVFLISGILGVLFVSRKRVLPAVIMVGALTWLYGFGAYRLSNAELGVQNNIKLRIVSVPFDQADKFDPEKSVDIVNQFINESVQDTPNDRPFEGALNEVTHIIWPEGAVSGLAMDNEYLLSVIGYELASRLQGPLPVWLLNSLRTEQRPNPVGGEPIDDYYNSSVAVTFDNLGVPAIAGYNDKARLVPFGEFIPFGKWMEAKNVPVISTSLLSISPAKKKTLAQFPGLPLGSPQICYEVVFPGFTPKSYEGQSAAYILNQSNDAWFGKSWGPAQHANIAQYRAIEEGLPLIRAASNGVSAVIDPYGRILAQTDNSQPSHIDVELPTPVSNVINSRQMIFFLFLINFLISLLCVTLGRAHQRVAII
jgi:apolipoprotein N-acyltransferase